MNGTDSSIPTFFMSHDTRCLEIVDGTHSSKKIGWCVSIPQGTSVVVRSNWNSSLVIAEFGDRTVVVDSLA